MSLKMSTIYTSTYKLEDLQDDNWVNHRKNVESLVILQGLVETLPTRTTADEVIKIIQRIHALYGRALRPKDFFEVGGWRAVSKAMKDYSDSAAVQIESMELLTFVRSDGLVNSEEAAFLADASLVATKNFPSDEAVHYYSLMTWITVFILTKVS